MFDPSKLDIDFSDTSDLKKVEETKKETQKAKAEQKSEQNAPQDVLWELNQEPEKDTIDLEKNTTLEDKKYTSDQAEVDLDINKKQDTETLATIITDSELVEKNKKVKEFKEQQQKDQLNPDTQKVVIDINIEKLDNLISIVLREKYDYFRVEPQEDEIKITFVKDSVDKDVKFIKFPSYSRILIEMKKAWNLKLDITDGEQKGKGKYDFLDKKYNTLVKTKANAFWESVYFKIEETQNIGTKKKKEKISLTKILWFLLALLLSTLIIGWLFLGFILYSSNTIRDLQFFNDLGIDVDKIRQFVAMLVNVIFFVIVFILTGFSITYIFKAILTKKEYKKKKIWASILAIVFLIFTLISGFLWLSLAKKVTELKSENYGESIIYDNTKLLSSFYDGKKDAQILKKELIWPINLKFDISEFLQKIKDDGNKIQKVTWVLDGEEIEKPSDNTEIIYNYTETWAQVANLIIDVENLEWENETIEKNIAEFDVQYMVDVNERTTQSGGKIYSFNAESLTDEGKIEWYYIPDTTNMDELEKQRVITESLTDPIQTGPLFSPQEVIFDKEIIIGMKIVRKWQNDSSLDKIFIIWGENESEIQGSINSSPSLSGDLSYDFWLSDLENSFGNGFIESVVWDIGWKIIKKEINLEDIEKSSRVSHSFSEYWENRVIATLNDSNGNKQVLESLVKINKTLDLKSGLNIYNDWDNETIGRYNSKAYEYRVNSLAVPTTLNFDARYVSASNQLYVLKKVEWDYDNDGNIDDTWEMKDVDIKVAGNTHIVVYYTFEHRKITGSTIEMKENIYIDSEKKDVILNLQVEKESNYVPVVIRFDASKSQVKWEDIEKFIYDYGDGTPLEERDAINPGHKYVKAGKYTVTLTVVTTEGNEYTTSKQLNLLNKPQDIVISTSLKKTKTFQDINFSSEKSNGQITSYYWDFWDGTNSTIANPVKSFQQAGTYLVKLRWIFENNNVEEDEVEIIIE